MEVLPTPENLEVLERAYQCGWLLTSRQLAPLLGTHSQHLNHRKKSFTYWGFAFRRGGLFGLDRVWRVGKPFEGEVLAEGGKDEVNRRTKRRLGT